MIDLFLKGGIVMWGLLALSIFALAVYLHRYFLLVALKRTLKRSSQNLFALAKNLDTVQQGVDHLYLVCSLAPLLGLLGTVFGIIKSFTALSVAVPDTKILSLGLSEALFTTAAGLIISIPCQIAGHLLQQKKDKLVASLAHKEVESKTDNEE